MKQIFPRQYRSAETLPVNNRYLDQDRPV
jgi:hypothetical protein